MYWNMYHIFIKCLSISLLVYLRFRTTAVVSDSFIEITVSRYSEHIQKLQIFVFNIIGYIPMLQAPTSICRLFYSFSLLCISVPTTFY